MPPTRVRGSETLSESTSLRPAVASESDGRPADWSRPSSYLITLSKVISVLSPAILAGYKLPKNYQATNQPVAFRLKKILHRYQKMQGHQLRQRRVAARIPGQILCNKVGISRGRLSDIEREYVQPRQEELARLNGALDELISDGSIVNDQSSADEQVNESSAA